MKKITLAAMRKDADDALNALATPAPVFKKDMIVFGADGKNAIGSVSGCRATTTAQYVTIRLDHNLAVLPIKMEIRG